MTQGEDDIMEDVDQEADSILGQLDRNVQVPTHVLLNSHDVAFW